MHIFVTGGLGYIGSVLVPKLLNEPLIDGVTVFDISWFGNYLNPHPNLKVVKGDIRENVSLSGFDVVIHLAAVANDPAGDLNPKLTWEINALSTMRLADQAARDGVQQFIYASSGSVYGISDAPEVTEELPLVPLTEYNKTKMVAERCVLSYAPRMGVTVLRPATVCGVSPRMRLDTMVNSLTMQALDRRVIKMKGGHQYRPNIHIEDMADIYVWALLNPKATGIFNCGFENLTILRIAQMVSERTKAPFISLESNDPRSYRINSDKLLHAGFKPRKKVEDAIKEIIEKYQFGQLKDEPQWHTLSFMPT